MKRREIIKQRKERQEKAARFVISKSYPELLVAGKLTTIPSEQPFSRQFVQSSSVSTVDETQVGVTISLF